MNFLQSSSVYNKGYVKYVLFMHVFSLNLISAAVVLGVDSRYPGTLSTRVPGYLESKMGEHA